MAASVSSGPLVSLGGLTGAPSGMQPAEYSQQIGPSIFWSGFGVPIISAKSNKDSINPGAVPAIYAASPIQTMNSVPVPGGATLASAASAVNGVPLNNATAFSAGIAPGTGAIVNGQPVTNAIALDIAIDKAGCSPGNNVIVLTPASRPNIWRYSKGMWIAVAGAGPAGSTLFAQITAVGTTVSGNLQLSVNASTTQAAAEVGLTNRYSLYDYGNPPPTGVSAFASSGMGRFLIPECSTTRGVGVTGVAASTGGPMLIQGLDIFNQLTSEIIAVAAGANTTYGKKTYKVFLSATPQFNNATAYTVVTSDLIGLPIAVLPPPAPPPVLLFGGVSEVGLVTQYADPTNPATTSSGDPRGAIQMSAKGPNAGATFTGPDGASVVSITQTISALAACMGNMFNPSPLFGVTPV
jgi:hypothetical protein